MISLTGNYPATLSRCDTSTVQINIYNLQNYPLEFLFLSLIHKPIISSSCSPPALSHDHENGSKPNRNRTRSCIRVVSNGSHGPARLRFMVETAVSPSEYLRRIRARRVFLPRWTPYGDTTAVKGASLLLPLLCRKETVPDRIRHRSTSSHRCTAG